MTHSREKNVSKPQAVGEVLMQYFFFFLFNFSSNIFPFEILLVTYSFFSNDDYSFVAYSATILDSCQYSLGEIDDL